MKYILNIIIFFTLFTIPLSSVLAQSSWNTIETKKPEEKKENIWKDKMWYGGGINLQLYQAALSTNVVGNIFEFGVSPIAGYKVKNWWSVGPRIEISYVGGRFSNSPNVLKLNGFNYGFGAFTRLKFLKVIFAHIEYSTISTIYITGNVVNNRIETKREFKPHFLTGLGYNPTGLWSYEFYIMYDFLSDPNSTQLPIQYRAGITYNF
ncbi:MAG: hypothetical protein ABI851_03015 [Saprospiraceae bacterium]